MTSPKNPFRSEHSLIPEEEKEVVDRAWKFGTVVTPSYWRGQEGAYILMAGESPEILLTRLVVKVDNISDDMKEIKDDLKSKYVTQEAFNNLRKEVDFLKKIIYTIMSVIGLGFLGAVLRLVIAQPGVPGVTK